MPAKREYKTTPESVQLGRELRALRTLAKLSQADLAEAIGKRRSTVQRAEAGQQPLSRSEVQTWLGRTDAAPDVARRITALSEAAHGGGSWSDILAREQVPHLQHLAARRDEDARLIRSWTPSMVPALAQTDTYARALLTLMDVGGMDIAAATAARMQRQRILYEQGRRFEFLLGEEALRRVVAPGVMPAQLERLRAVAALDTVDLAVVPFATPAPPWPGFVYREPVDGAPYVTVELPDSVPPRIDPESVDRFLAVWQEMWAAAARGDDALALIRSAQNESHIRSDVR